MTPAKSNISCDAIFAVTVLYIKPGNGNVSIHFGDESFITSRSYHTQSLLPCCRQSLFPWAVKIFTNKRSFQGGLPHLLLLLLHERIRDIIIYHQADTHQGHSRTCSSIRRVKTAVPGKNTAQQQVTGNFRR